MSICTVKRKEPEAFGGQRSRYNAMRAHNSVITTTAERHTSSGLVSEYHERKQPFNPLGTDYSNRREGRVFPAEPERNYGLTFERCRVFF